MRSCHVPSLPASQASRHGLLRLLLLATLLSGCAAVPQEAVVLSEDVGGILEELRQKNSALIDQLYVDRKARVNAFVDNVYAPAVVRDAITRTRALERIAASVDEGEVAEALSMMEAIVRLSRQRIEQTRRELLSPLEAQEAGIRAAFDASFGVAIRGTETTTGLLRSVRAVHDSQERLLGHAGIEDLRATVNARSAQASRRLQDILAGAATIDGGLDSMAASGEVSMDEASEMVRRIKDIIAAAGGGAAVD